MRDMLNLGAMVFAINNEVHAEIREEKLWRRERAKHPTNPTKKRAKVKAARKQRKKK